MGELIHLPVEFDNARPYGPQCVDLADKVGLTPSAWKTLPIVVNPPGLCRAVGVAQRTAWAHGLLSCHCTLTPRRRQHPTRFEFAEIINLQALKDAARERGKHHL